MTKCSKKILFALPIMVLCACTPKYTESIYVSDYTGYVKSGFQIYPAETDVKEKTYIPMADIEINFRVGRKSADSEKSGLLPTRDESNNRTIYIPNGSYITKKVVDEAKKYGANALINYKSTVIRQSGVVVEYNVTGVAVRIEQ